MMADSAAGVLPQGGGRRAAVASEDRNEMWRQRIMSAAERTNDGELAAACAAYFEAGGTFS